MSKYPVWFTPFANPNFEKHLMRYANKPNLKFLQLGTFTGDASVWLLDNVLTNQTSILYDVDTWRGSDEKAHEVFDFDDVHLEYRRKTSKYNNVSSHEMDTVTFMAERRANTYDFIYIDADHSAAGVISDAIHAWRVLKPGGLMAFDDYKWEHEDGELYMPIKAVDFFLWAFSNQLKVIDINQQVWVEKL